MDEPSQRGAAGPCRSHRRAFRRGRALGAGRPGGSRSLRRRDAAHRRGRRRAFPPTLETEVSATFADDATVKAANADWRGKDRPTNILSFPMASFGPDGRPGPLLGDLLLAFETVEREAATENKAFADHLRHLLVHGFLHLVGHDHVADDEAETMEALEVAILHRFGVADPYREPERDGSGGWTVDLRLWKPRDERPHADRDKRLKAGRPRRRAPGRRGTKSAPSRADGEGGSSRASSAA